MRLFIPPIGAIITLEKDWTFTLYHEYRNTGLAEALGKVKINKNVAREDMWYERYKAEYQDSEVTLPAGTKLKISRIYIRNGVRDYNSVTFIAENKQLFKSKKPRFWAKLPDVNKIVFKDNDLVMHKLMKKDILNG